MTHMCKSWISEILSSLMGNAGLYGLSNRCTAMFLLFLLQKAGALVERAQQTSEEQREALNEFQNVLVKKEVLAHKDKVRYVIMISFSAAVVGRALTSRSNYCTCAEGGRYVPV